MTNLQCDQWQIDPDGVVRCLGAAVESVGLFPALTESEAIMIATAVASLFATVFGIRLIGRVIR